MNKERRGNSCGRNRKVYPKTPRALSGAPLSLEARKYSAIHRRAQDRLRECICYQMLRPGGAEGFCRRFAFSKQVAMNDACVIRRLQLPLSPKIENLWGPHIKWITRSEHRNFSPPHASEVSGLWRVGNLDKKKHKWPYKNTRARGCSCGLSSKIRTPPLWENTAYLLTNSPEIRSSHFCAYFIAIAYSRKRTKRFYIINNHSVFSCASTWFTEWLSIMWL